MSNKKLNIWLLKILAKYEFQIITNHNIESIRQVNYLYNPNKIHTGNLLISRAYKLSKNRNDILFFYSFYLILKIILALRN